MDPWYWGDPNFLSHQQTGEALHITKSPSTCIHFQQCAGLLALKVPLYNSTHWNGNYCFIHKLSLFLLFLWNALVLPMFFFFCFLWLMASPIAFWKLHSDPRVPHNLPPKTNEFKSVVCTTWIYHKSGNCLGFWLSRYKVYKLVSHHTYVCNNEHIILTWQDDNSNYDYHQLKKNQFKKSTQLIEF